MATITELLDMTAKDFKKECRQVNNRIRRIERAKGKETATDTMIQELRSLKDYTQRLSEAVRQWF